MFDDIIYKYRHFLRTYEHPNSKFLYDICFGFKPAKFEDTEHDRLILDEENEVDDIYFIQKGQVGIGYYMMTRTLSTKQFKVAVNRKENSYICDYYVLFNKKSEFIYIALSNVESISLSKKFL